MKKTGIRVDLVVGGGEGGFKGSKLNIWLSRIPYKRFQSYFFG